MPKQPYKPSNPLEQAMEEGTIGYKPPDADQPEGQKAGTFASQPASMPEFQNSSTLKNEAHTRPEARISEFQKAGTQELEQAGIRASQRAKSQKVNRDGWEQQTIYMPPDLRRWLKLFAATTERELSDIVTEAVQEFRAKQQRGAR